MTARAITSEQVIRDYPDGNRVLYIVPVIPEEAPPEIREGLARRRIATLDGTCPCGSSTIRLTRQQRRARQRRMEKGGNLIRGVFEHATDCPAADHRIFPLLRAWLAGDDQEHAA